MYDITSAIQEDAHPTGNVIQSLGFEDPPRIHARHLDVSTGDVTNPKLREGGGLFVESVGEPQLRNEATRTKRKSPMPPSVLYAKEIEGSTPSNIEDDCAEQEIHFPITKPYTLDGNEGSSLVTDGTIAFSLTDLQSVTALVETRRTLTGTCEKHKSVLPFAVTSPAIRLETRLKE